MAENGGFSTFMLILLFGSSIAALGLNEMNQKYIRGASRKIPSTRDLVRELRGETTFVQADGSIKPTKVGEDSGLLGQHDKQGLSRLIETVTAQ